MSHYFISFTPRTYPLKAAELLSIVATWHHQDTVHNPIHLIFINATKPAEVFHFNFVFCKFPNNPDYQPTHFMGVTTEL